MELRTFEQYLDLIVLNSKLA